MALCLWMPRFWPVRAGEMAQERIAFRLDDRLAIGRNPVLEFRDREIAGIGARMIADQPVGKQDQISRADFSDAAVRPAARRAEPARRHANFFRHIIHSLDESSFAAVDAYGKNRCRVIPRNGDQSFEERSEEHTSEL